MKTERYVVWLLKAGSHYWTGRSWDMRPYNAKCYGTVDCANEAKPSAVKKTTQEVAIVNGTLEAPC
jgi:hypothetical protein